jgi:pSer/pThr/pTyr-binding forkhead associated (FHA) protein
MSEKLFALGAAGVYDMRMDETLYKRNPKANDVKERKLALKFKNRSIFLPKKFVIGRDEDCDIALVQDSLASRRHAMIEFSQGEYAIKDLGSTNGTFVNGRPLAKGEKRPLEAGDVIVIGKTEITVSNQ